MNSKNINPVKFPISAFVVTFNEENLIKECLDSIDFCQEVLVADLGSSDNSVSICKKNGATVVTHERLPSSEYLRPIYVPKLKYDWVLIIDPDEVVTPNLKMEIHNLFPQIQNNPNISNISVPWKFYFGRRALKGTAWGGKNSKNLIVNRNNFSFVAKIHSGQIRDTDKVEIKLGNLESHAYLKHKWMRNWFSFFEKHLRYLKVEGDVRYESNSDPKLFEVLLTFPIQFYSSMFLKKGYLDGFLGFSLSLFWATYQFIASTKHYYVANKFKGKKFLSKFNY